MRNVGAAMSILVIGVLLVAPVTASGAIGFSSFLVASRQNGEPSILVQRDGVVLATAPGLYWHGPIYHGSELWRSTDGGATFPITVGRDTNGDTGLAEDADGRVYISDMTSEFGGITSLPVSVSLDGGRTIAYSVALDPSAGTSTWDRQWIAAEGHGHAVVTAKGLNEIRAWVTNDGGRTWPTRSTITTTTGMMGRPAFGPNGELYFVYCSGPLHVARSTDGGTTWSDSVVPSPNCSSSARLTSGFPSIAVDAGGTVYVAWAGTSGLTILHEPLKRGLYLSRSFDHGVSWSQPISLAGRLLVNVGQDVAGQLASNPLFPWIVAGAPGHVAIAYYDSTWQGDASAAPPTTSWDVKVAYSLDANSMSPTFDISLVRAAFHMGSICVFGTLCENFGLGAAPRPLDRRVLDFFEMTIDMTGRLIVVHPLDRSPLSGDPNDVAYSSVDIVLERQVSGPLLR